MGSGEKGITMYSIKTGRPIIAATLTLFITVSLFAQTSAPAPEISSRIDGNRGYTRSTPIARIDRSAAFARLDPEAVSSPRPHRQRATVPGQLRKSFPSRVKPATAFGLQSFGTGGGDLNEVEPNDSIAQNVSLPVNVFGRVRLDFDIDFFAFQAIAGQQVVIEAFAARLPGSELVADLGLFTAAGDPLDSSAGAIDRDPLIRFRPLTDQVLIVGITDADDLGGARFDYILNVSRGVDVAESEPNGSDAQALQSVPATVFGSIANREDVDFFSFEAAAGQTLIVDIDSEVLGSSLDAETNLSDPQTGIEYFYSDQTDGDDPRFNIVLPFTGRYVIGVGSFGQNSSGFYRLNLSLVSGEDAPVISGITRISKKLFEVSGSSLSSSTRAETNGIQRKTTFVGPGLIRVKAKTRAGTVVTVTNPPDGRRSNPLVVQ
jgi:hypothetical protein